MHLVNTCVGESRGKPRFYLQGNNLASAGFSTGAKYYRKEVDGKIVLCLGEAPEGFKQYQVSKRTQKTNVKPVIDHRCDALLDICGPVGTDIRILVKANFIVVSKHFQNELVADRIARLIEKLSTGTPLRISSLYHGGGIMDAAFHEGLEKAGIAARLGLAVEIEQAYMDCSMSNNPVWDEQSISILSPIEKVNFFSQSDYRCDGLIAGIPCTGASRSGKARLSLEHAESHPQEGVAAGCHFTLLAVQSLNPAFCTFENVADYSKSASCEILRAVLRTLGYQYSETVLRGSQFGVLEDRERWVMVVTTNGLEDVFSFEQCDTSKPEASTQTLEEILDPSIPLDSDRWKAYDYLKEKEVRDKKAGKSFRRQVLPYDAQKVGTIGRGYAKARSTEPFVQHPVNPELSRLFVESEHVKAKGIPENLIDGLSATIAHQVLGQSVIYPMFVWIGEVFGRYLNHVLKPRTVQTDLFQPLAA